MIGLGFTSCIYVYRAGCVYRLIGLGVYEQRAESNSSSIDGSLWNAMLTKGLQLKYAYIDV